MNAYNKFRNILIEYRDSWTLELLSCSYGPWNKRHAANGNYSKVVRQMIKFHAGLRKTKVCITFY